MSAKEVFIKHWNKVTKLPCDDAVMAHMQYCLDAMEEYAKQQVKLCNKPAVSNNEVAVCCNTCKYKGIERCTCEYNCIKFNRWQQTDC